MDRRQPFTHAAAFAATTAGLFASSVPVAAAHDPLLELIREYQGQMAIYNSSGDLPDLEDQALAAATWHAPYDRLCFAPPAPSSDAGVLAAVQLIAAEVENCGYQPELFVNVLNVTAAYLQGRSS